MEVIFFTHAESFGDEKDIIQGHTDFDLTKNGINQAKKLTKIKSKHSLDNIKTIYSSDLIRCLKTAQIAFPDIKIISNKNLREQDFGSAVGSLDDFLESNPEYLLNEKEAFNRKFPNGESIKDVEKRVKEYVSNILESHSLDDTIIFSCHFTPLICILSLINNESLYETWSKEHINNGDILYCTYSKSEFNLINRYNIQEL